MGKFYEWVYQDLTQHVKTLAWWHATPNYPQGTVLEKEHRSRLNATIAQDATFTPSLPEIEAEFGYLITALFEAGPVSSSGMGVSTLTWSDLAAWEQMTGSALKPWESRVLRRLSADYLGESQLAEKPDCPCPYMPEDNNHYRSIMAKNLRQSLRQIANL